MNRQKKTRVLEGRKILIIEDDIFISRVYLKWLTFAGAEALVSHDGADGIKALREHVIDLVLLDLGMPGIDGFETLRLIHQNERTKHIPIVILTNTTMHEGRDGFKEITDAGVRDILQKYKTSLNQLVACIEKYFPSLERQGIASIDNHEI